MARSYRINFFLGLLALAPWVWPQDQPGSRRDLRPSFQVEMRIREQKNLVQLRVREGTLSQIYGQAYLQKILAVERTKNADLAQDQDFELTENQQDELNAELDKSAGALKEPANAGGYSLYVPNQSILQDYIYDADGNITRETDIYSDGTSQIVNYQVTGPTPAVRVRKAKAHFRMAGTPGNHAPVMAGSAPRYREVIQKISRCRMKLYQLKRQNKITQDYFTQQQQGLAAIDGSVADDLRQATQNSQPDISEDDQRQLDSQLQMYIINLGA